MINFWTTWCPACVSEMPELVALQKQHGDRLAIIGVSLDFVPDSHGHIGGHPAVEEQAEHTEEDPQERSSAALKKVRDKVARTAKARGAATIVMVGAAKDRRLILPHSRVMLHQPSQGFRGTASDIAISAREILRLRQKANELFALETGQPLDKIERDMHRDYWMGAEETVKYGLCSRVISSAKDIPS